MEQLKQYYDQLVANRTILIKQNIRSVKNCNEFESYAKDFDLGVPSILVTNILVKSPTKPAI